MRRPASQLRLSFRAARAARAPTSGATSPGLDEPPLTAGPRATDSRRRSPLLLLDQLVCGARFLASCAVDAVAPHCCVACHVAIPGGTGPLCSGCADTIANLRSLPYCPHCARSMRPEAIHEHACARCIHENHWNVAAIVRVGPYETPLREITLGLKYGGQERCARLLADLLAGALRATDWLGRIDGFVPIPIHPLRRLQRPCAHAAVLTEQVAQRLGRPVWHAVRRTRYAPSQMDLDSRANRFENVAGCFGPRPEWLPTLWPLASWPPVRPTLPRLAGRTVCIVDNVLTTGATLHEVSRVLRKAGAKRIYAAVVSRAAAAGDFQADTEGLLSAMESLARDDGPGNS